ncbi:head completion/stabilization protein [Halomonas sp. HMF6819]|uniref:head completion/stabilization protein n=1 Tax=Halomonas sp. HMF6819 TaxID=3373085 RepID=UPI0037ABBD54
MNEEPSIENTPEPALANNGFWPDIDPHQPPASHSRGVDIFSNHLLLTNALMEAMTLVNAALMPWQAEKEQAGYSTLSAVPVPLWQDESVFKCLYFRALFSAGFAKLLEAFPDTDTSPLNIDSTKAADSYWRDATWAVGELLGEQVELLVT